MPLKNTLRALLSRGPRIPPDESVVFFPTVAGRGQDGTWRVPIHGWIFRPAELSRLRRAALRAVKFALRRRVRRDAPGMPLLQRRVGSFLADNSRWHRVHVRLMGNDYALQRSRADGHFTGKLQLPTGAVASGWLDFHALSSPADLRHFAGRALLLPPAGLSVISDIDDTVKITEVKSGGMLRNTFLREFACVPQMAALYRRWALERNAAFHYVSASPWQLYPFLAEFLRAQEFPAGTFHLRDFRLVPGSLHHTLRHTARVKRAHARHILRLFPHRRFILVGDSGESDPLTYARLARHFPDQVEKIFIRDIGAGPAATARWTRALAHLPRNRWQIFRDPEELA
jgi:phosphatidate phosphatase APP1